MSKRGQVTVFIFLGILIVLIITGFIFFRNQTVSSELQLGESSKIPSEQVRLFVQACLEKTTTDGIQFVSSQGGYFQTPAPYYEYAAFKVPYYFNQQAFSIPSTEQVEQEINSYINQQIMDCLASLSQFPEKVTVNPVQIVTTTIESNHVESHLELPISIQQGDGILTLTSFVVKIPAELGKALEMRQLILNTQQDNPNTVRMSRLVRLAEEQNFKIHLTNINSTVFYRLEFPDSPFPETNYTFLFAIKYDWNTYEI